MKASIATITAVVGIVAASDCPAPGQTNAQGYGCNPAHQYPGTQVCKQVGDCLVLVDQPNGVTASAPSYPSTTSASSCPAPGETNAKGYGCNPAHQYPGTQVCKEVSGCLVLVDQPNGVTASAPAYASSTSTASTCPAPGETNAKGYGCNPAHQYPGTQVCKEVSGCLVLVDQPNGVTASPPAYASSTSTASTCPAPGETNAKGYGCNPAHQYPGTQVCKEVSGCLVLVDQPNGVTASASSSASTTTAAASSCPAPGETNSKGYGCNPAHQYPGTQVCKEVSGCLVLVDQPNGVTASASSAASSPSSAKPTTMTTAAAPSCPAPGETNSKGYGCNPAHQYPGTQVCKEVSGCLVLVDQPNGVSASAPAPAASAAAAAPQGNGTSTAKPSPYSPSSTQPVTAGAGSFGVSMVLGALMGSAALLMM